MRGIKGLPSCNIFVRIIGQFNEPEPSNFFDLELYLQQHI